MPGDRLMSQLWAWEECPGPAPQQSGCGAHPRSVPLACDRHVGRLAAAPMPPQAAAFAVRVPFLACDGCGDWDTIGR